MKTKARAVFLDRDGTLIDERGYLSDANKIRFYPSVFPGLKLLQKKGFKLIVITNQSGVGRGYFSLETLHTINKKFIDLMKKKGVNISRIYFCPHLPEAGCACRKPKPKLALQAARDFNIDLKKSFMVGDQARDVELAHRFGGKGILVLTGGGKKARAKAKKWTPKLTSNVFSASRWILNHV